MKTIRYQTRAATALRRHRNMADRLQAKIRAYAENPTSQAANVKRMKGSAALRLRIGDFRVIFEETASEIIVLDIGPRGDIYD